MSIPASATVLALLFALTATSISAAPSSSDERLKGDSRLQQTFTVRVSRMPLSALLRQIGTELGVSLTAQGEDVADQKVDLFTHGPAVSAAEILLAIPDLLNAEGPRGYWWERSGQSPGYRYALVRSVSSRQWEERQAAAAAQRLVRLLRTRLASLGNEPFRPDPGRTQELPSMRRLLSTLSDEQIQRLLTERVLLITPNANPSQKPIIRQLVDEMSERWKRTKTNDPRLDDDAVSAFVYLLGDPPRYTVDVRLSANGWHRSTVCQVIDPVAVATTLGAVRPPSEATATEPAFTLSPHASWRLGDVLAQIAARADLNLIADDYVSSAFNSPTPSPPIRRHSTIACCH